MLKLIKFKMKQYTRPIGLFSIITILCLPFLARATLFMFPYFSDWVLTVALFILGAYLYMSSYMNAFSLRISFQTEQINFMPDDASNMLMHIPISFKKINLARLIAHIPTIIVAFISFVFLGFFFEKGFYEMEIFCLKSLNFRSYLLIICVYVLYLLLVQFIIVDKKAIMPKFMQKIMGSSFIDYFDKEVVGAAAPAVIVIALLIGIVTALPIIEYITPLQNYLLTIVVVLLSVAFFYLNASLLEKSV
ncbi:MAG: hypothetical protein LR001_07215 [Clostridiales bacterium]|nr:hypothetical protein [Clostridiales bacterium]